MSSLDYVSVGAYTLIQQKKTQDIGQMVYFKAKKRIIKENNEGNLFQ